MFKKNEYLEKMPFLQAVLMRPGVVMDQQKCWSTLNLNIWKFLPQSVQLWVQWYELRKKEILNLLVQPFHAHGPHLLDEPITRFDFDWKSHPKTAATGRSHLKTASFGRSGSKTALIGRSHKKLWQPESRIQRSGRSYPKTA